MPGPLPHGDTFFLFHSTYLRVGLEGHEMGTVCPPRPHGKQVVTRAVSTESQMTAAQCRWDAGLRVVVLQSPSTSNSRLAGPPGVGVCEWGIGPPRLCSLFAFKAPVGQERGRPFPPAGNMPALSGPPMTRPTGRASASRTSPAPHHPQGCSIGRTAGGREAGGCKIGVCGLQEG